MWFLVSASLPSSPPTSQVFCSLSVCHIGKLAVRKAPLLFSRRWISNKHEALVLFSHIIPILHMDNALIQWRIILNDTTWRWASGPELYSSLTKFRVAIKFPSSQTCHLLDKYLFRKLLFCISQPWRELEEMCLLIKTGLWSLCGFIWSQRFRDTWEQSTAGTGNCGKECSAWKSLLPLTATVTVN